MEFYVCPNCGALFCETESACPGCGFDDRGILKNRISEFNIVNGVLINPHNTWAFYDEIDSAYIPDTVTSIGKEAFLECPLSSVYFSNTVKTICEDAFLTCNCITDISFPDGLYEIKEGAFCCCESLRTVHFPDSLKIIGNAAFLDTGIKELKITPNIQHIGLCAFGCSSLEKLTISGCCEVVNDAAFIECYSLKEVVLEQGIKKIGSSAFMECSNLESIHLPDSIVQIDENAFCGCANLRNIDTPQSIEIIGNDAFKSCSSLIDISIPDSIKEIGESAFYNCTALKDVSFFGNNQNRNIKRVVCSYEEDSYNVGTASIKEYAFEGCISIEKVNLPDSVGVIGGCAFKDCKSLKEFRVPKYTRELGFSAFQGCSSLEKIDLSNYYGEIYESTFEDCLELTEISLKSTAICPRAFKGCIKLASVKAPWVLYVKESAFSGCKNLQKIELSTNIELIDAFAFRDCISLKNISIPSEASGIDSFAFEGCPASITKIAPFTDKLKKIDIVSTIRLPLSQNHRWNIFYDTNVPGYTKIPGLIEFLDEEMNHIIHFIQKIFGDNYCLELFGDIPIILSPLYATKTYGNSDKSLDELIAKYEKYGVMAIPTSELKKAVASSPMIDTLLGKYCPSSDYETPVIYIYYRTLNANDTKTYLSHSRNVLAHEIFHAVHHKNIGSSFINSSFNAKCVKESLADFFAFMYSTNPNLSQMCNGILAKSSLDVTNERYNLWKNRQDTLWPYAYALCIMSTNSCPVDYSDFLLNYPERSCVNKFKKVFKASHHSMDFAYAYLTEF